MSTSNTQIAGDFITQIASDLNEKVENRYALVLGISDLAKRLLDDAREKARFEAYNATGGTTTADTSLEKAIYQALIMKASEEEVGDGLIG